jgi:hypothetical protein
MISDLAAHGGARRVRDSSSCNAMTISPNQLFE